MTAVIFSELSPEMFSRQAKAGLHGLRADSQNGSNLAQGEFLASVEVQHFALAPGKAVHRAQHPTNFILNDQVTVWRRGGALVRFV